MSNSSTGPTPGQSGRGVMAISQSSSITEALPSEYLVSGHLLGDGFYHSVEMQSVYSTAPAYWAIITLNNTEKRKRFSQ